MKALVLSGGMMDLSTTPYVVKYLDDDGYDVYHTEQAADLCSRYFSDCELLVLNSCLWTGSGHTIEEKARAALMNHMELGKGLVVMHSSIGNWDDWPDYIHLVGGVWNWTSSAHSNPDYAFIIEKIEDHPILEGVPDTFEVVDEMYYNLDLSEGNHVIARTAEVFGGHPMVWHRRIRNSRVAAIMIGHNERAVTHPVYVKLLHNACSWTTGRQTK